MKNIKGKHCANCYNCRCISGRAWCDKKEWRVSGFEMFGANEYHTVDIRAIISDWYKGRAKQCPEYMSMEG